MSITIAQAAPALVEQLDRFGPGGGPLWFLRILIPLLWIGIIVAVVLLLRRSLRRRPFVHAAAAGEQALATRFANGEIDETEYRARLEVLRSERDRR
ncbi:hypothetical protein [Agrococcus sp. SGAir0287]|uniref:hypothetical protein n=1 Tax=Agrococcus sp. SGAir0287 TaxID=2070347 RepID=UPI0010CCC060|nr:hypothetical protein [Agrococcus sp. SGAir0287]QCR20167.1 hypothetical protein C1N71_12570 [Agrococcus sp. SGAir0287]